MKHENPLIKSVEASLRYEYIWGRIRMHSLAHHTPAWCFLPYLIVLIAHRGEYRCEFKGLPKFIAKQNEVLFVPPDVGHDIRFPSEGELSGIGIRFTCFGGIDVLSLVKMPTVVRGITAQKICSLIIQLASIEESKEPLLLHDCIKKKVYAFSLLDEILAISSIRYDITQKTGISRMIPILTYIQNNLHRQLTRSELARNAMLSQQQFHVVFKRIMGMAPMEYVLQERLKRAHRLLLDEKITIGQVGEMAGFCDQFHFSKQFKKLYRVTPSVYRKNAYIRLL